MCARGLQIRNPNGYSSKMFSLGQTKIFGYEISPCHTAYIFNTEMSSDIQITSHPAGTWEMCGQFNHLPAVGCLLRPDYATIVHSKSPAYGL